MKLTELELLNFRGAKSLEFRQLDDRLNVFVGVNGAGKSTVLDATAILLSWMVSRIRQAGTSGQRVSESDITNGESTTELETTCEFNNQAYSWKLTKTRKGHSTQGSSSSLKPLNQVAGEIQAEIWKNKEITNIPLMAYYPVNRAVVDIPLKIRKKHHFNILAAYEEALGSGASFRQFFEWYREREDLENEIRRDLQMGSIGNDLPFPDPELEAVRKAIEVFLPGFKNLTVRRSPLRMEVEKEGDVVTVSQLSDGEKCLMAMVGDLARRLAIANPATKTPLEGEGIVLIDEIDLHLHPKWQRLIVPRLLDMFPNCQFLITTHSPHVITHVQPENLFLLKQSRKGIEQEHPSESYGKTVDRVLEDLMGLETTRPDRVSDGLHQIYEQINEGRFDLARQKIDELRKSIGSDPELAKAEVLIRRKEIIGK